MFGWTHKWSGGEGQSENSYKNEDSICTVQEKSEVVECRDIVARLVGQDKNNDVGHNTRDMGVRTPSENSYKNSNSGQCKDKKAQKSEGVVQFLWIPDGLVLVVVHRSIDNGVHNIRLMFEQLRIVAVDLIHTEYCMVHQ